MSTARSAKVLTVSVLSETEIEVLRGRADDEIHSEAPNTIHSHVTITLKLTTGTTLATRLAAVIDKEQKTLYLSPSQLEAFSDNKILELVCEKIPQIVPVILENARAGRELPFLLDKREPVFVPLNRSAAAGLILAFYNDKKDPLERIRDLYQSQTGISDSEVGRILTTYYLSCIMYVTNLDFSELISEEKGMLALTDDLSIIPRGHRTAYNAFKKEPRHIPQGLLAFQAVFGAYCMCRPVANKKDFRSWITKRYSAFMASIQQSAEVNVYLDYQKGGTLLNETVVSRTPIRRLIYSVVSGEVTDIIPAAIKVHIKMLVALSEMTTYSLIQQVISRGGCVVALDPLPKQLGEYVVERDDVLNQLDRAKIPRDHIVYLHLVLPHLQAFIASKYADLVVTAQTMEEVENPRDNTLDSYKAKITNAVMSRKKLKQFLTTQAQQIGLRVSESEIEGLRAVFGDRTDEIYNEARRILTMVRDQRVIQ